MRLCGRGHGAQSIGDFEIETQMFGNDKKRQIRLLP